MLTTIDTARIVPRDIAAVFTDCFEELESKILFHKKSVNSTMI
jgi:hypothetical protein